jgi:cytochrome c oxidase cbb3-type subunit III
MMRRDGLPLLGSMLLLAAPLSACGQNEEPEAQATTEPEPVEVWSLERMTGDLGEGVIDRLPASATQTVLIPATSLFPGGARIGPAIDNPYAGDAAAIAASERHFAAFNCAGCHAPLGGGGLGPPLSDDEWIYGAEPAQIYLTIVHGRPEGMPAFGSMLPRQTIWELVAYIDTLDEIENPAAEKGFDPARGENDAASEAENTQADQ